VRHITSILAILVVAGWVACNFDVSEGRCGRGKTHANSSIDTQWRHTKDGWEKASTIFGFRSCIGEHPGVLPHPIVLAVLVALASTLALLAFSPATPAPRLLPAENARRVAEIPLRSRLWLDPLA
jgi:hypothetical protein